MFKKKIDFIISLIIIISLMFPIVSFAADEYIWSR